MGALRGPGFLGTGATLLADVTLVVQILFFAVLCLGVIAQLVRSYHWHDRLQIPVVVLNLFFISLIMVPSFAAVTNELPAGLRKPPVGVSVAHGLLGLTAQALAIYCLLAGLKILPRKIGVLRYWMWATFGLWSVTALFGAGIYLLWYASGPRQTVAVVSEHDADVSENSEPVIQASPTPPPAEAVSEHAEAPAQPAVNTPTAAPAAVAATQTPTSVAPVEATVETLPGPSPTPSPFPTPLGWLYIADGNVHSDQVRLQLAGVAPPAADAVYKGWLQGQGVPPLSLGVLNIDGGTIDHTFTDPAGRDLLDLYDSMFVSVEPAGSQDQAPSGQVVYTGQVLPAVLDEVRSLVSSSPTTPGLAVRALARGGRLIQLAQAQQDFVTQNDLANLYAHAENALNIIEGAAGPNYGDADGDGQIYTDDPNDPGLLTFGNTPGYIQQVVERAAGASQAPGATAEVVLHAGHVQVAGENALAWTGQIRELELQILQAASPAAVAGQVAELNRLANILAEGVDANGDGQIAPVPGEGGLRTMYDHAQLMAGMAVLVKSSPAPATELTGEHDGADVSGQNTPAALPTPTPVPATDTPVPIPPTATPVPPSPTPVPTLPPPPTPTPTVELISEHDQ